MALLAAGLNPKPQMSVDSRYGFSVTCLMASLP